MLLTVIMPSFLIATLQAPVSMLVPSAWQLPFQPAARSVLGTFRPLPRPPPAFAHPARFEGAVSLSHTKMSQAALHGPAQAIRVLWAAWNRRTLATGGLCKSETNKRRGNGGARLLEKKGQLNTSLCISWTFQLGMVLQMSAKPGEFGGRLAGRLRLLAPLGPPGRGRG